MANTAPVAFAAPEIRSNYSCSSLDAVQDGRFHASTPSDRGMNVMSSQNCGAVPLGAQSFSSNSWHQQPFQQLHSSNAWHQEPQQFAQQVYLLQQVNQQAVELQELKQKMNEMWDVQERQLSIQQKKQLASALRPGKKKRMQMKQASLGAWSESSRYDRSRTAWEFDNWCVSGSDDQRTMSKAKKMIPQRQQELIASKSEDSVSSKAHALNVEPDGVHVESHYRGSESVAATPVTARDVAREMLESLRIEKDEAVSQRDTARIRSAFAEKERDKLYEESKRHVHERNTAREDLARLLQEVKQLETERDEALRVANRFRKHHDSVDVGVQVRQTSADKAVSASVEETNLEAAKLRAEHAEKERDMMFEELKSHLEAKKRVEAERDEANFVAGHIREAKAQVEVKLSAATRQAESLSSELRKMREEVVGFHRDKKQMERDVQEANERVARHLHENAMALVDRDDALRDLERFRKEKDDIWSELENARAESLRRLRRLLAANVLRFKSAEALDRVRQIFQCPLTMEVMQNPVIAADGHTYEFSMIARWFEDNTTSPMTGLHLRHRTLWRDYLASHVADFFAGPREPIGPGALLQAAFDGDHAACLEMINLGVSNVNATFDQPGYTCSVPFDDEITLSLQLQGATALHLAAWRGWKDVCRRIIAWPDFRMLNAKTVDGSTAFEFAEVYRDIRDDFHQAGMWR